MTQQLHTVAIDLAKKVFHLVGADTTGKILWRKRLTRQALMPFIAQLPPVLIGIEACGGAHDWARRFRDHGHEVKLMAPQFAKPFVKSNKNDMRDAEAIAEAVTRNTLNDKGIFSEYSGAEHYLYNTTEKRRLHSNKKTIPSISHRKSGCSPSVGIKRALQSWCARYSSNWIFLAWFELASSALGATGPFKTCLGLGRISIGSHCWRYGSRRLNSTLSMRAAIYSRCCMTTS
jgi:hypothetical protein